MSNSHILGNKFSTVSYHTEEWTQFLNVAGWFEVENWLNLICSGETPSFGNVHPTYVSWSFINLYFFLATVGLCRQSHLKVLSIHSINSSTEIFWHTVYQLSLPSFWGW